MIDEQQKLYKRIKCRYEAYLRDSIKHGLVMFVLREKEADILAGVGYKRTQSIMRGEVPQVLKAFESLPPTHEQISLF